MQADRLVEKNDTIGKAPLISVIVPIYNVEKYVRKCLESLQAQTMRKIEVICIDDGSTDGSGRIADEFAREDKKFRVIHTENRGLSAARNRGIDESRADWLMFVDSDDWVDREFCRVPWEMSQKYGADLLIFSYYRVSTRRRAKRRIKGVEEGFIDHEKAVDTDSFAWNKLYKKCLFEGVRYPEGLVYEDIATTYKIIYKASIIYLSQKLLYYHRIRRGSISLSASSNRDFYWARKQQATELPKLGYPRGKAQSLLQLASLDYCGHSSSIKDPLYCEAERIVNEICSIPNRLNAKGRLKLSVWKIDRRLYRAVYGILGKRMKSR